MPLPGVRDRSEFTSAVVMAMSLYKVWGFFVCFLLVLVIEHLTHAISLNPPSINCIMF